MKILRRNRQPISLFLTALMLTWQVGQPLRAASLYWDTDSSAGGNLIDGSNLGGTGTWDTTTANWWDTSALGAWPNTAADVAIFSGLVPTDVPNLNTVTLGSGLTANKLVFNRSGYTLAGADLTLAGAGAGMYVQLGETNEISAGLAGTDGLTKTGGGTVRLSGTNTYTGATTISNGSLIITNESQLGADTSVVTVTGFNPVPSSTNLRGFGGGALVLDGTTAGFTLSRDLSLQGQGPLSDRSAALVSVGNNTLSGLVSTGVAYSGTNLNTRISSANGTLTFSDTLNVLGTAGTTITTLGGTNQGGVPLYNLTGALTGSGTLEKSGAGTLFLNPSDSSGFSGNVRVGASATGNQSEVRITSPNVLGTRTASTTSGVIDMNTGVLSVLMDTPSVQSGGVNANVYGRATSTFFVNHGAASDVVNGVVNFGNFTYEDGQTFTFNSRNGYGVAFTTAPVNGGNGDTAMTNNMGGLLSFTGNFWSNTENTGSRLMSIGGNGNTLIDGNILATSVAFDHNLTKSGAGVLTVTGTGSTLDGAVSVTGGALAIRDFRSVTNNTNPSTSALVAQEPA